MPIRLSNTALTIICLSWFVSLLCLYQLWRSSDYPFFKISLSLLLPIPLFGPVLYFWIRSFPQSKHPDLMDRSKYHTDVLDRWRDRLEASGQLPSLQRWGRKRRRRR
ncbi:MAG TPA: hypothetical protein P5528_06370 [Steroidobacteraceae bacterium]|nr:hypothetical protein [Steroidobacteraceae bacterium]HRX89056.1 hypothetical protein [Steroidobacteraceae bacterium]